jgi:hypothetical protein
MLAREKKGKKRKTPAADSKVAAPVIVSKRPKRDQ